MLRIKEIAKAKGYQMKELAELVGIDPVTLSRINTERESTTLDRLKIIAKELDVQVKDLFSESSTIHLILNDKAYTFYSLEELKEFIQKKTDE
ncbi:helix-turn-helix domain-containing protein [Ornithobacterium rhinotracheale]|uniref:helix-turn-helix domain-containing protein n=1 Tax=Ornithobacterium rhinotracheale TaxID=28251 RepID=UPI00129CD0FC|nr:helix-turn-helix transcriptional regulator [Ornithobacterium rhinotracheale]MRI64186.1 XRE family transcriptional regulator [Ornithobacterium rhinotracheale]MRJ09762.1 XRE family transcriptional regulator [Ornithobacterium rhinotracheale]